MSGLRRRSKHQKRVLRARIKQHKPSASPPTLTPPAPSKKWDRTELLTAAALAVAVVSIVIQVATPEVRKRVGLDHAQEPPKSAPSAAEPANGPATANGIPKDHPSPDLPKPKRKRRMR